MALLKLAMASSSWPLSLAEPRLLWAGRLRVELDGLPVAGDRLIELALVLQRVAQVVVGLAYFGSSSMALRKLAMASSNWPLACSALPRLSWAAANFGSSSMAFR